MKLSLYTVMLCALFFAIDAHSQKAVTDNYKIDLSWKGTAKNPNFPIQLQEKRQKEEVVYTLNGNKATKQVSYYETIDSNFSVKTLDSFYHEKKLITDIVQENDKLILRLHKGKMYNTFNALNTNGDKRLAIDISDGVEIIKTTTRINVITVPFKVYLSNRSTFNVPRNNNVVSTMNIGFTVGSNREKHIFRKNKASEVRSSTGFFGYAGLNKVTLNTGNTDNFSEDTDILSLSLGGGIQLGYKRVSANILVGLDFPMISDSDWIFRNQPWIGFGLGYAIADFN